MTTDRTKLAELFNDFTTNPGQRNREALCTVIEVGFLNLLTQPVQITRGLLSFLNQFANKPAGEGALCACCDNEWLFTEDVGTWPNKFFLMIPNGAKAKDIGPSVLTVTVLCRECKDRSDREIIEQACSKLGPQPGSWRMGEAEK